jgi:DNA modification methylase
MITILAGNCRAVLPTLAPQSAQCIVTSPPYWRLRNYGADGQIGNEPAHDCMAWAHGLPLCGRCYVCVLREVAGHCWRVLRDNGTFWLNLGDTYSASGHGAGERITRNSSARVKASRVSGIPVKNLLLIPARVVFALQADGWIVRSEIVWAKLNPSPDGATDRPAHGHELVYLLTKRPQYYYDAAAIAEPTANGTRPRRTVWPIMHPHPSTGADCPAFPEELPDRCIRAGSRPGDVVLDPFAGSGTVGLAAERLQRDSILIELHPDRVAVQERRSDGIQQEIVTW